MTHPPPPIAWEVLPPVAGLPGDWAARARARLTELLRREASAARLSRSGIVQGPAAGLLPAWIGQD